MTQLPLSEREKIIHLAQQCQRLLNQERIRQILLETGVLGIVVGFGFLFRPGSGNWAMLLIAFSGFLLFLNGRPAPEYVEYLKAEERLSRHLGYDLVFVPKGKQVLLSLGQGRWLNPFAETSYQSYF